MRPLSGIVGRQHVVEGGDAVAGDHEQEAVRRLVQVADLAAVQVSVLGHGASLAHERILLQPAGESSAESDVAENEDQVEPDSDAESVGRVAGDDRGTPASRAQRRARRPARPRVAAMRRYLAELAGLTMLTLVAGCGGGGSEADPTTSAAGESSAPSESSMSSSALPLLGPVGLVEAADGTVWAAFAGSDVIAPVQEDGTGRDPVQVGDTPLRMAELDGSLWVTTIGDGGLAQVDPQTGAVGRTVTLGEEPEGITTLDGHLFVVLQAAPPSSR